MLFDRPIAPETFAVIRYGTGFPARDVPVTATDILTRLTGPDHMAAAHPFLGFDDGLRLGRALRRAQKAQRMSGMAKGMVDEQKAARRAINAAFAGTFLSDMARRVDSDDPFRERLTAFWLDHFTARDKSVHLRAGHGGYAAQAIRPHLTGRFADLLRAASLHGFMLLYLDQSQSYGPNSPAGLNSGKGLNENLAREMLELHSLGVDGSYDQGDVTELAELLTGLTFTRQGRVEFRPRRAEPGAETVLGRRYGGAGKARLADIEAALDDLATHPDTAAHICRKLAVHFVADDPDPDLVAAMTDAYARSGGVLAEVYAAMLDHPAAWAGFGAKIKWPADFMASAARALGLSGSELRRIKPSQVSKWFIGPMRRMGQQYRHAPGPDGWPEAAEAWVNPSGVAARIAWAMGAARRMRGRVGDPRDFVTDALGDAAGGRLIWAAGAAESRQDGIGIVLASAEFNRR